MAEVIPVAGDGDVYRARRLAKQLALQAGFGDRAAEEIAIVAGELAANLIKHSKGGSLTLASPAEPDRAGIRIEAHDEGPGIPDVERALTDGYSTAGSLGYGLGTVNRLVDQLTIESSRDAPAGTHVVATRWLRKESAPDFRIPLDFAAATRPFPGMTHNGDSFVIKRSGNVALIALIDGLGHGPLAQHAAHSARNYAETHFDLSLESLFEGLNRACRGTRGVVIAAVRFDRTDRLRFSVATVGNVAVRLFGSDTPPQFQVRRGIVGLNAPKPKITDHEWDPNSTLVLHSDGISSHWNDTLWSGVRDGSAAVIAGRILRTCAKDNDDATVLVVKRQHET